MVSGWEFDGDGACTLPPAGGPPPPDPAATPVRRLTALEAALNGLSLLPASLRRSARRGCGEEGGARPDA